MVIEKNLEPSKYCCMDFSADKLDSFFKCRILSSIVFFLIFSNPYYNIIFFFYKLIIISIDKLKQPESSGQISNKCLWKPAKVNVSDRKQRLRSVNSSLLIKSYLEIDYFRGKSNKYCFLLVFISTSKHIKLGEYLDFGLMYTGIIGIKENVLHEST